MKVKKIKVPFYKWSVVSIIIEDFADKDEVIKKMKSLGMLPENINNISEMCENEAVGGAVCHCNKSKLLLIIVTFPHTSTKSLVSTLIHEGRHAADTIISSAGLEGLEASAYLSEFVIFEMIKDYIKDEVNKS